MNNGYSWPECGIEWIIIALALIGDNQTIFKRVGIFPVCKR